MALQSRNLILAKRAAGIANLSAATLYAGAVKFTAAAEEGILKTNCTHQVGIATQTEVGLAPSRYPIRIVIVDPKMKYGVQTFETVCRYWGVKHADGSAIQYSRKPNVNNLAIQNLYGSTTDLDKILWKTYRYIKAAAGTEGISVELDELVNTTYELCCLINPTNEQLSLIGTGVSAIIAEATDRNVYPYFKIGDNAFMTAVPHGKDYTTLHTMTADIVALTEGALTAKVNYDRMKARHDDLADGIITLCAYTVMSMFRHGLAENYESLEYYTVAVAIEGDLKYRVEEIFIPAGAGPPDGIALGQEIDLADVTFDKQILELSNLIVMSSGMMHYLFNHTTGGLAVSGTLLSTLTMFQFISSHHSMDEQISITNLLYETLHPTNKRAIANLFFSKSGVTTHGRSGNYRKYEEFEVDAFFEVRRNPHPAGSHKAFICLTVLKRVLQAGLGPFLPWANQLTECINSCKDVLSAGARAHIGSYYYTGDPPIVQPSALDQYLPELAMYIHIFNKGDSLAMSPHMSSEIYNKSAMNWQNLLKDLKAKDVSSTPAELVRAFLATAGSINFAFDPNDEGTWAGAIADSSVAAKLIDSVFS